jgi:hypothetical protein
MAADDNGILILMEFLELFVVCPRAANRGAKPGSVLANDVRPRFRSGFEISVA